ncbi:MAG: sulfotransferase [Gammaproteobacteria bacterium]|nr:sulfotransferase [Gammaproteobacteria bacterium]
MTIEDNPIAVPNPNAFRAANAVGRWIERCGFKLLEPDRRRLLAKAAKAAGHPYANSAMIEGLDRLIASIKTDAQLNLFGKFAFKRLLQRAADGRFRVEKAIAQNPQILDEPIREPVFIIGMPRSGTTILQAMLNLDAAHRSPLCWECMLPHPAPTPADYRDNERIDTVRKEFDGLLKLVPDFRKMHYIEADSPQECFGVTLMNFTSFQFVAQAYLRSYSEWFLEAADQTENLRWHRRFLQFLQSGGLRSERWLLKSPVHLMRLKALYAVYPDARIIVTHRHPAQVVPSLASLLSTVRSVFSDHETMERSGREQLHLWARCFDRFLEDRKHIDRQGQMVDVLFDDFAADQMGVVRRIYDQFGWQLDAASAGRMEAFLRREPKDRHGKHEYSLDRIGVRPAEVETRYRGYLEFLNGLTEARGLA